MAKKTEKSTTTGKAKNGTVLIRCNCVSPVQDSMYDNCRVANMAIGKGQARCTVCGTLTSSYR